MNEDDNFTTQECTERKFTMQPLNTVDAMCPVDIASRIIGQKWTLQIVHELMDCESRRFCELQEALGGVNPSTLSSRLKMLEEEGLIRRLQISAIPPHVEYSLTQMGTELHDVIGEIRKWSRVWLCNVERQQAIHDPERQLFAVH